MTDPTKQPEMVREFLRRTLPFSELDGRVIVQLARECRVDFVPAGTAVLQRGFTRPAALLLVQKGGVRVTGISDDGSELLADVRGEGAGVGAVALLEGGTAIMDVETVEDTFFVVIPRHSFLALVEREPIIGQYYVRGVPERFVSKAFAEMRVRCEGLADEKGLYLFASRVGDLVGRGMEWVPRGTSLRQAAERMVEAGVGSLLVRESRQMPAGSGRQGEACRYYGQERQNGQSGAFAETSHRAHGDVIGIVTDSDLRKAVSLCMDYLAPVETLMTSPVVAVEHDRPCFDALLEMMRRQIHHLAVARNGEIYGIITAHDIMVMQGRTPLSLFREILQQRTPQGLYPLGARVIDVVRGLVEEGARAGSITRMITVFNDLILEKTLSLVQSELGPPPLPFAWLCMGSEGRREQTFKTDQDNALVVKASEDEIINRAGQVYFAEFATRAVAHLAACGFTRCPGDIMASNHVWRKAPAQWEQHFLRWIYRPEPQEIRNASIFFDFRAGYGHAELVTPLRDIVNREAGRNELFLHHLAADCLEMRPPLTFFRNFIVEKDGERRNTLDLKRRGAMPFVDAARVLALRYGIAETNTLDRLLALETGEHIPVSLGREAREAYEFIMHLRLVHQVAQAAQGQQPDNHLDPSALSELEKRTLKEAFAVAGRLQMFLKESFHLSG